MTNIETAAEALSEVDHSKEAAMRSFNEEERAEREEYQRALERAGLS